MKYLLLLPIILFSLFISQPVHAQNNTIPSVFFCVGDNPQAPCATVAPTQPTNISTNPSNNPNISINPVVSTNPQPTSLDVSPTTNPLNPNPCQITLRLAASPNSNTIQAKHHHSTQQGILQQFFQLLLQLIFQILDTKQPNTTTPCSQQTSAVTPTSKALPTSEQLPTLSVAPTTKPNIAPPTPTIFDVSPSPLNPISTTASITPTTSNNLTSFFSPTFSGNTFCIFSHQVESITGNVLTTFYPSGSSAPSAGAPYGGAQICIPYTKGKGSDATLVYSVRFPIGFQFVKGGKLPGIYGGVEPFSGGGHNAKGWSMRLMWRTRGAGEIYGYISTTTNGYGDDWGLGNFTWLADGQWHQVLEHIHLNTPNQSNGYVTLSYSGKQVINITGLAITTTNTPITGLFFSTFYGGHDKTWAPTTQQHIDFMGFSGTIQ